MGPHTKECGFRITFKEKEPITGLMEGNTLDNGEKINCTAMVSTPGKMEESTRAITLTIKRKALEFILGLMVESTKETGSMESSMEKVDSSIVRARARMVFGKMEKESNGSIRRAITGLC